jgi:hypothetical protein
MSGGLCRVGLCSAVAIGLLSGLALADDGTSAGQNASVARLEALLEAQQKKIDALEQQVVAAQQSNLDAARVDQMKQQIREVLSEREFRESLMPTTVQAGYDKGFFIKSSDDKFKIVFNGVMQFRWTYYQTQPYNHYLMPGYKRFDRTGFDWNRFRFITRGYVYTPDLTYHMELEMGSANQQFAKLLYGWMNYRFMEELQLKAGVFRLASTRADSSSTSYMQFPEYPMVNGVFGLVRGTGIRLWGKLFNDQGEYFLDVVNSLVRADSQTITNDENIYSQGHDSNPAIVFRTVWQILRGEVQHPEDAPPSWWDPSADLEFHTTPALNVGMHYGFKSDWIDGDLKLPYPQQTFFRPGGFGLTNSEGTQMNQIGVDAGFKYQGFSLTGEYIIRIVDVTSAAHRPYTPLYQFTGDSSTGTQQGGYVQAGYLLPIPGFERKLEVVARVGGVSSVSGGQEGTWDYSGGLNYYIQGNKVKLQADVTQMTEAPFSNPNYGVANVNDNVLLFRLQFQVAF